MANDSKREESKQFAVAVLNERARTVWPVATFVILIFVWRPVQTFMLVCWTYGSEGYFRKGIRLLPVKPPRFTDGSLVPQYLDIITGMMTFLLVGAGVAALFVIGLWCYQRGQGERSR